MKFIFPGNPIALKRHRTVGKIFFDPQVKEKKLMASQAKIQMEAFKRRSNAIKIELGFYMPIPKSWPKKRVKTVLSNGGAYHVFVPDTDNLIKFICDALNTILWDDDCIISEIHAFKRYSDNPRTELTITDLPVTENIWLINFIFVDIMKHIYTKHG